uniref:Transglutaminase-like domain-containing protein n=1 Tax=Chrysotila carterae TaxID=13221 RepID=A0A7S4C5T3_CHRCT|mmetsp:Transcript_2090/g.4374  ORF Transcript_2090/g.4374 Transcript_2090/m.4374 type:complete len:142 (+) Transcript_2090:618-1043(+)
MHATADDVQVISYGQASCSGLSILLACACRSVGIPARLVVVPRWADAPHGNHAWVEVYDSGRWGFIGAAEPADALSAPNWFHPSRTRDAPRSAGARGKHFRIFASTWRRGGLAGLEKHADLPLPWETSTQINGIDVTDSYQ